MSELLSNISIFINMIFSVLVKPNAVYEYSDSTVLDSLFKFNFSNGSSIVGFILLPVAFIFIGGCIGIFRRCINGR